MSTNQEIWGDEADWLIYNTAFTGTTKMNALLTGNFGTGYYIGSVHYTSGCLQTGYYNDVLPIYRPITGGGALTNDPIDNSISYCGLGNESTYSRLAYLEYKVSMFDSGFNNVDDRAVTNFAFCASQGSNQGFNAYNDSTTTAGAIQASRCRIAPMGYNGDYTSISKENFNRHVTPYVSIPVRNFILTPVVLAASTINTTTPSSTTGMDIRSFAWWDYMDITQQRNYTTHPYILQIGVQPFCSRALDTIDPVTGVPQTARSAIAHASDLSGVMILSPLTVCDGEPSDVANPQEVLTDIYSYYLTRGHKASTGNGAAFPIFGYSAIGLNDQNYIAAPQTNSSTDSSARRLVFWTHPNAQLVKVTASSGYTQSGWYYLEYYNGLFEWVIQQIACFGLFFTFDRNTAQTGALNDPLMYLGILDENGIGHGNYSTGEDNEDQPQWEWDTTNNSSYKPSDDPEPTPYGDKNHILDTIGLSRGGKYYWSDTEGLWANILADINNISMDEQTYDPSVYFGQEPIDCLIEGRIVFVNGALGILNSENENVMVGRHDTGVEMRRFRQSYPYTTHCGFVDISEIYNDFRDYEPYTTITLLLPFAGSMQLPTSVFMGHRIDLYETVDLITGDIIYTIWLDNNTIYSRATGNCSMELSKNGYEMSQFAQTRFDLQNQKTQSLLNAAASFVGGTSGALVAASYNNPAGAISQLLGGAINAASGIHNYISTDKELHRSAPPVGAVEKASGCVEYGNVIIPAIVITSPKMIENYSDDNYRSKTGFSTYKVDTIGSQSGPVVCRNVVINSIACTPEEKQMIKQLLESGVYIK